MNIYEIIYYEIIYLTLIAHTKEISFLSLNFLTSSLFILTIFLSTKRTLKFANRLRKSQGLLPVSLEPSNSYCTANKTELTTGAPRVASYRRPGGEP
jgi:hypothetical protein